MLKGHGDDLYQYTNIHINFSSNIYSHFNHEPLFQYLTQQIGHIKSYPEPTPVTTEALLAQKLGIQPEEICVTNGATEAIYLIAQAFRETRSAILQPTFSEYADACRMQAHKVASAFRLEDIPSDADNVWICNPNNPTGTAFDETTADVLNNTTKLFILDHSYASFTLQRLLSPKQMVDKKNVLALYSMTKDFSIPGIRLGYVIGHANLIQHIKNQRMPWSVNEMAICAAQYLIAHTNEYNIDVSALLKERERVEEQLSRTGCVELWPSDSHMLLCQLRMGKASALKEYLAKQHGILIRDASNFMGLSDSFFRIAIQTPAENDLLVKAINQWMEA